MNASLLVYIPRILCLGPPPFFLLLHCSLYFYSFEDAPVRPGEGRRNRKATPCRRLDFLKKKIIKIKIRKKNKSSFFWTGRFFKGHDLALGENPFVLRVDDLRESFCCFLDALRSSGTLAARVCVDRHRIEVYRFRGFGAVFYFWFSFFDLRRNDKRQAVFHSEGMMKERKRLLPPRPSLHWHQPATIQFQLSAEIRTGASVRVEPSMSRRLAVFKRRTGTEPDTTSPRPPFARLSTAKKRTKKKRINKNQSPPAATSDRRFHSVDKKKRTNKTATLGIGTFFFFLIDCGVDDSFRPSSRSIGGRYVFFCLFDIPRKVDDPFLFVFLVPLLPRRFESTGAVLGFQVWASFLFFKLRARIFRKSWPVTHARCPMAAGRHRLASPDRCGFVSGNVPLASDWNVVRLGRR